MEIFSLKASNSHCVLFCLLILSFLAGLNCQQTFVEQPQNSSVLAGGEVKLKCKIKNLKGEVTWCKDEGFCTFGRSRNFTETRYTIEGDVNSGEHNLVIKNATLSDNTQYQCQASTAENQTAIKSDWAFLTVIVEPTTVKITPTTKENSSVSSLILYQANVYECTTENSNPPANITWFLDSQELKINGEVTEISKKSVAGSSPKLFKTTGRISIKPNTTEWNNKQLRCETFVESGSVKKTSISDSKQITTYFAPVVKLIKMQLNELTDGVFAQFMCQVTSTRPPVNNYRWSIDSKEFSNGPQERFLNLKIEQSMHKKLLKCEARNEVATTTALYQLEITNPPRFVKPLPAYKLVNYNDMLELNCEVESFPPASIYWSLNNTNIYAYPNFTISAMGPENYGLYTCSASLKDFPVIMSSVRVIPPGPPVIQALPKQHAYYGSRGEIKCSINIEPKADSIEWYKNGRKINLAEDRKYSISSLEEIEKIENILIINEVSTDDKANFTCKAVNSYGTGMQTIEFVPKMNSMVSFLSAVVVLIFLLLFSGGISVYLYMKYNEKKSKKKKLLRRQLKKQRYSRGWQHAKNFFGNYDINPRNSQLLGNRSMSNRSLSRSNFNPLENRGFQYLSHPILNNDYGYTMLDGSFTTQMSDATPTAYLDLDNDCLNQSYFSIMNDFVVEPSLESYYDQFSNENRYYNAQLDTDV